MFSDPSTLLWIAVWSASALAILSFAKRWYLGQPLIAYAPRKNVPWNGVAIVLAILGWMVIRGIGADLYGQFHETIPAQSESVPMDSGEDRSDGDDEASSPVIQITSLHILYDAIFSLLAGAVMCGLMRLAFGSTWTDLGFCFDSLWADIRLGILAALAVIPSLLLLQMTLVRWFPSKHQLVELFEQQSDASTMAIMFFSAVIVAPLTEEFFIRSILQGWLEKRSGELQIQQYLQTGRPESSQEDGVSMDAEEAPSANSPAAHINSSGRHPSAAAELEKAEPLRGWYAALPVLVSSACFAIMHVGYGPDPIPIFLLALVLGFLYQRTHRLIASITVHALLNGTSLALLWVSLAAG